MSFFCFVEEKNDIFLQILLDCDECVDFYILRCWFVDS